MAMLVVAVDCTPSADLWVLLLLLRRVTALMPTWVFLVLNAIVLTCAKFSGSRLEAFLRLCTLGCMVRPRLQRMSAKSPVMMTIMVVIMVVARGALF